MKLTAIFSKKGKIFYRSIAVGLIVVMIIEVVLAVLLHLYLENDRMKNIKSVEQNEMSRVSVYIESIMRPLISTAAYFSNIILFNDESGSYFDESNISNNMMFYKTTHDYVNGITISTGEEQVTYGQVRYDSYEKNVLFTNYNIRIEYPTQDEWPHTFWVIHETSSDINRKVVIEVNVVYLASNIFLSGNGRKNYVVTEQGYIFFSNDFKQINSNIYAVYPELKVEEDSILSQKINGESVYVTASKMDNYNLRVISIASNDAYSGLRKQQTFTLTIMIAVIFVALAVFLWVIVRKMYKPIEDVVESLRYHLLIDIGEYQDEIIFINDSISNTLRNNDDLKKQLNRNIELLHKYQVQALQSQINPHFLYNTIDAIKWLAVSDLPNESPVELGLVNLRDVISVSFDLRNIVHTLDKEIGITEKYCELINLRYGGEIDFIWEVDKKLLGTCVPKLMLQPIIENSVNHGICNETEKTTVKIRISAIDGNTMVEIADNGQGIPEDRLKAITESLSEEISATSKHIGLKNIHKRIQLLYGEQYGVEISSVFGKGTFCRITLPSRQLGNGGEIL